MNQASAKRAKLRAGLRSESPVLTLGAHDALSALLAEKHGFDAVWVSGFGICTMTYAMPDLNLVSMAETLEAAVRMDAATSLPVVADCDNGFGGYSNFVRTVTQFERAGIAGICVEDNTFPKRNSLYRGESVRELLPVEEQSRRIRAAKEAQHSDEFVFIARVEALIAGHGIDAAVERAAAYADAGADAILIHSRDKSLEEITAFLEAYPRPDVPLVAVPTLFPDYTADELSALGFNMVIYANQAMRAAVSAMEETMATLKAERKPSSVDGSIAAVDYIFDLVGTKEEIQRSEATS